MSNGVILDNWALQDIGSCLADGLQPGNASEIIVDMGRDSHTFRSVPHAGLQIEALIDLLIDIVLQDSICVDSAFTNTWQDTSAFFAPLLSPGLLRPIPFLEQEAALDQPRRALVESLCMTSSLRQTQRENEASWRTHRKAANQYMSALVWGSAGMLARSHVFEAQYHGCPARKRLLEQAAFISPHRDATRELVDWVESERLRIFQVRSGFGTARRATLVLPPIAVEIIDEARDPSELVGIAYQKRDKYKNIREWLKEIQLGLDTDQAAPAAKFKKTLAAISRDLDATLGAREDLPVSVELTYGYPSVSVDVPVMSGVRKRFGVSAVLNRMLLADRGAKALKRLLRLFGEEGHAMELAVVGYLGRIGSSANAGST